MTTEDLLKETSSALLGNKVRSGLTVLGIVIGIASVIAMLAVGQGASGSIQSSIDALGSNLVMVTPGAQKTPGSAVSTGRGASETLKSTDADAIAAQVPEAKAVAADNTSRKQVTASGTNTNTSIIGTVPNYETVRNVSVDEGSFISDSDVTNATRVAVLGPTTRDDLFGVGGDSIGKQIRIGSTIFTVIGVTTPQGGSGFNNSDDRIFIPLSTDIQFLVGSDYVTTISIEADSASDMTQLQADVTTLLLQRHNISDPTAADFTTLNQADIISSASTITTTLTYLLASVAGISLVVGGIGIMNMMLTTVTERTREIGLRKAIGAKKKDISTQFLVESIMLTSTGGIAGIILGWAISFAINLSGVLKTQVSISSIVLAVGVSTVIGVAFGYYPARRAASLNPIEALRFE